MYVFNGFIDCLNDNISAPHHYAFESDIYSRKKKVRTKNRNFVFISALNKRESICDLLVYLSIYATE